MKHSDKGVSRVRLLWVLRPSRKSSEIYSVSAPTRLKHQLHGLPTQSLIGGDAVKVYRRFLHTESDRNFL
jgi:hypothetical protein